MTTNYTELTQGISKTLVGFGKEMPEVMTSFHTLSQSATKEGALSKKTKELIALGISVAKRCDPCIGYHMKALIKLEVTRNEVLETLNLAVYLGGGPALMYAAKAIQAFEELTGQTSVK